jgi:hypothetical protein
MRLDPGARQLRRELRKLLPVNKDDVAAIEAIADRGYPAVEPILGDLLKWIREDSWPVAKPARDFLGSLGTRLAPQIEEVLDSGDDSLKATVLREFVSTWPADDVRVLSSRLFQLATHGQSWGADLLALRLLARHGIGEPQWIAEWLTFKRRHHEKQLADIAVTFEILRGREPAG